MLAVTLASGAGPEARLDYRVEPGVSGCPDEAWVRNAVSARLGRDPFRAQAPLNISVRIGPAGAPAIEGLVEVTRADGTTGRRTIDSPTGDCPELASAVELAITLVIEPRWLAPPKAPPPPAPAPTPPPPPAAAPPVAETPLEVQGRVGPLFIAGNVPGFTLGLALGGALRWPRFSLALEGHVFLPSSITYGELRVSTFTARAALLPCLRLGPFSVCGELAAGALQVESLAALTPRQTTPSVQLGARAEASIPASARLSLAPWLGVGVNVVRTSIGADATPLWVTWPVALSAGVALQVTFSS